MARLGWEFLPNAVLCALKNRVKKKICTVVHMCQKSSFFCLSGSLGWRADPLINQPRNQVLPSCQPRRARVRTVTSERRAFRCIPQGIRPEPGMPWNGGKGGTLPSTRKNSRKNGSSIIVCYCYRPGVLVRCLRAARSARHVRHALRVD